ALRAAFGALDAFGACSIAYSATWGSTGAAGTSAVGTVAVSMTGDAALGMSLVGTSLDRTSLAGRVAPLLTGGWRTTSRETMLVAGARTARTTPRANSCWHAVMNRA